MPHTNTPLSQDMDNENPSIQYDRSVKRILAHKPILARILRYTVQEVANYDIDTIQGFINSDVAIGTVAVNPDQGSLKIVPQDPRDEIPLEGVIFYDVRFSITLPDGESRKIIVNVEAQRKSNPGYSLVKRGIFYVARLLSGQLSVEFTNDGSDPAQYDKLKKVYSIWICMNCPASKRNSIVSYTLHEDVLFQDNPQLSIDYGYDMVNVTLIHLNGPNQDSENQLIAMLDTLLGDMDVKAKKAKLENNFKIPMTRELNQEVEDMCNLSADIMERGIDKGRKEGRKEGRLLGKLEGQLETLKQLVTMGKLALKDAAEAANMSPEEFKAAVHI